MTSEERREERKRRGYLGGAMIIAALGAVFILSGGTKAWGQEHQMHGQHGAGHAENHDWYKNLRQPGTGYSCCNGTQNGVEGDCRPTRAYQEDDGSWRALINGEYKLVPPAYVLRDAEGNLILAPDGRNHVCAGKSGAIYCFLGTPPKS